MRNKKVPNRFSTINCNIEWHCFGAGTLVAAAAATALYHIGKRISRDSGVFRVPVSGISEHLGLDIKTARLAYHFLVGNGFFVVLREVPGAPTEYHVLDHNEWAAKHPGKCCVKLTVNTTEPDTLRAALHGITGKNFWDNYMDAIRKCGLADEYVIEQTKVLWSAHIKNPKGSFHNKLANHLRDRAVTAR